MIDLSQLHPDLQPRAQRVVETCRRDGVELLIYCGMRSPADQARLWRQSRTKEEILAKAQKYRDRGYPGLARVLLDVGPQPVEVGRHVTMAAPGESWHQYGEAFDAVPMLAGRPQWDTKAEAWRIYGAAVQAAGLVWAGMWDEFREYPHAQLRAGSNPLKTLTPDQVREALRL